MNNIGVRGVILGVVIICALGLGFFYANNKRVDPVSVVSFIYSRWDNQHDKMVDNTDEIGFHGFESLGYDQINNKHVIIKFGNMRFTLSVKDLSDKNLMKMLNRMGVTVDLKTDESTNKNEFVVKYKGELVDEYDLQVGKGL